MNAPKATFVEPLIPGPATKMRHGDWVALIEQREAELRRRLQESETKLKEQDDLLVGSEVRIRELETQVNELEERQQAYAASEQESVQELQTILGFPKPEEKRKWRWVLDGIEELKAKAVRAADLERVNEGLVAQSARIVEEARESHVCPPAHVVRSFEAGARAERARVLEQSRIELLSWPNGMVERRALDSLRKALQDERLPLPEFKP